jgi:hypothetical protein
MLHTALWLAVGAAFASAVNPAATTISAADAVDYKISVPCKTSFPVSTCHTSNCGRRIVDGVFADADIQLLHAIVEKGMSTRPSLGGPTILDINTGYIRDTAGLENLFSKSQDVFSDEDFGHYAKIISKLKETVTQTLGISELYFTAPTFITRLDGTKQWEPIIITLLTIITQDYSTCPRITSTLPVEN